MLGTLDGIMVWTNDAFARRLGWTRDEMAGRPADEFMTEEGRVAAAERRHRSLAGDLSDLQHDVDLRAADGSMVTFQVTRIVLDDVHGRPRWSLSIALDRTELDRRDAELVDTDEQLASIVERMPVGILRWDGDGIIDLARGQALSVVGLDADRLVGTSMAALMMGRDDLVERFERLMDSGEQFHEIIAFGGEHLELSARPYGTDGHHGGMVVGMVVTEHVRASQRTESLAELARETSLLGSDVDGVLDVIARAISGRLAPMGIVALFERRHLSARCAVHHPDPGFLARARARLDAHPLSRDGPLVSEALRSTQPIVRSEPTVERYRFDGEEAIADGMIAAIRVDGEPVGVVVAASHARRPTAFTEADEDFIVALADRAAGAISQALLLAAREAREAQQAAVALFGQEALAGATFDELVRRCAELVHEVLDESCALYLEDGDPDGMLLAATCGWPEEMVGTLRSSRAPGTPLGTLLGGPGPTVSDDLDDDSRFRPPSRHLGAAAAGVRIHARTGPIGALVVTSETRARFSPNDAALLESLANILASAHDSERAADELRHNALHDTLTGLPNRALLADRLEMALTQSSETEQLVGVILCDLDNFKLVNDSLGHAAGDHMLEQVSTRLSDAVRAGDTVARFGGDEFVVICPEIDEESEVVAVARRLSAALRSPLDVDSGQVFTTASMGIAFGTAESTPADLLRDADAALFRAKEQGRDRWEVFDDTLRARALHQLNTETALRRAIEEGHLVLHYQPIVAIADGRLTGVEALVRWDDPERGLIGPDEFLPVAEQTGLIADVGQWVLGEAARQTAAWARAGVWGDRTMSINVAAAQMDESLPVKVSIAARNAGADPRMLRVEITETVLLRDTKVAEAVLRDLRDIGVKASVDDFGTGYSSLAYLGDLPVDSLKIDRTFVQCLSGPDAGRAITAAIIELSRALGLRSIAEGVETIEQVEMLRAMGADAMQGFLVARPAPAEEITARLHAHP